MADRPKGWTEKQWAKASPKTKREARQAAKLRENVASRERKKAEEKKNAPKKSTPKKKQTTKKAAPKKKDPSAARPAGGTIKQGNFGVGSERRLGEFDL